MTKIIVFDIIGYLLVGVLALLCYSFSIASIYLKLIPLVLLLLTIVTLFVTIYYLISKKRILLYIAIIVTILLLLFMMIYPIFMKISPLRDPVSNSKQLLQSQIDHPGTLLYDSIMFTDKQKSLSASGISENTGLSENQVKFVSDLEADFDVLGDGRGINYKKSTKGTYKIGILCDYQGERLQTSIKSYGDEIPEGVSELSWENVDGQKVCIVFPKRLP